MRTPLTILSTVFGIAFLDGVFMWNLDEGFYTLIGLVFIAAVGWMWIIELKN